MDVITERQRAAGERAIREPKVLLEKEPFC